jgi:DNA polymerase-3 subunit beta
VVFHWADQVLTSRSLDGAYPNYRQLIPESFARSLKLDRKAFISALERVAVLADQHNNVVKITSNPAAGQLAISADAQDVGSGSEALAAEVSGDAIQIAFNVRYVPPSGWNCAAMPPPPRWCWVPSTMRTSPIW